MFYGEYEITNTEELSNGLKKYHYTHTSPNGDTLAQFEVLSEAGAALLLSNEPVQYSVVHNALLHTVKQEMLKVCSKYNIPAAMVAEVNNKVFEALKFAQEKVFANATDGQSSTKIGVGDMFYRSEMKDYI